MVDRNPTQSFEGPALDGDFNPKDDRFGSWSAAVDVGGSLKSLGFGKYEALFRAREIDASIVPELTDVDLSTVGVSLGHRKRLLRAISGLTADTLAAPSASTGPMPQDTAERRQLTVMFCDLVGQTPLVHAVRSRGSARDRRRLSSVRRRHGRRAGGARRAT